MKIGLPVSRFEYSSIFSGKGWMKRLHAVEEIERRLHGQAADAEVAGHHALAGYGFKESQNFFAFAEGIEEDGERANVHGVRAQPDEVRIEAAQLGEQHANPLRALGNFEVEQLFDGQAVAEVVGQRVEIIDAVGERDHLLIELGLAGLLDAGVQIADLGIEADDDFAVDLSTRRSTPCVAGCCGPMLRTMCWSPALSAAGSSRMGAPGFSLISGIPPPGNPCAGDGPSNRPAS